MVKPWVLSPAPQTTGLIVNPRNPSTGEVETGKSWGQGQSLLRIELRLALAAALARWGLSPSAVKYLTITKCLKPGGLIALYFWKAPPPHPKSSLVCSWQNISLVPLSLGQLWPRTPDCITVSPSQPSRGYGLLYKSTKKIWPKYGIPSPWPFLFCVTSTLCV